MLFPHFHYICPEYEAGNLGQYSSFLHHVYKLSGIFMNL